MFANTKHEEAYNLAKQGKLDEALSLFNEAILLTPNNPDVISDRGVLYIHRNDKTNALADFNKAIELQPEYSFRYSARAYANDYFGDTEAAVLDYEKAIELDPSDSVAFNNLGLVQEKLGYKKMAASNFDRADQLAKQEEKLHQLMTDLENEDANKANQATKDTEAEKRATQFPIEKEKEKTNAFQEFSKLFTSREQFGSFLKFLKNGFRIK